MRNLEAVWDLVSSVLDDSRAGWSYATLLTVVSIFNGAVPRVVKERLVFWPAPRPGSRAFSHFMFKDSTIDRKALQHNFDPLPSDPDEQNALWARWLNEFENDARVRPAYGLYLLTRDWTAVAAITFIAASPIALCLAEDMEGAVWYAVVLLGQCAIARWVAGVQGEQLVMSVMSCKGSLLKTRSGENRCKWMIDMTDFIEIDFIEAGESEAVTLLRYAIAATARTRYMWWTAVMPRTGRRS